MTDIQKNLNLISKAKNNGFEYAFLPKPDFDTVRFLRMAYDITQGWNNKYLTGYSIIQFGYLVKLTK